MRLKIAYAGACDSLHVMLMRDHSNAARLLLLDHATAQPSSPELRQAAAVSVGSSSVVGKGGLLFGLHRRDPLYEVLVMDLGRLTS